MRDDVVYLAAVKISSRLVILDDDRVFPITKFLDPQGVECEPEMATQAIAGGGETWFTFDPREWSLMVTIH